MSRVNSVLALLGGAAMGAIIALLLAPAKGEETREKIAEVLREKGIKLNKEDFNKLIDSKGLGNRRYYNMGTTLVV